MLLHIPTCVILLYTVDIPHLQVGTATPVRHKWVFTRTPSPRNPGDSPNARMEDQRVSVRLNTTFPCLAFFLRLAAVLPAMDK